jgi:hypothetical protein
MMVKFGRHYHYKDVDEVGELRSGTMMATKIYDDDTNNVSPVATHGYELHLQPHKASCHTPNQTLA